MNNVFSTVYWAFSKVDVTFSTFVHYLYFSPPMWCCYDLVEKGQISVDLFASSWAKELGNTKGSLTLGLFFLTLETMPCLQHSWPHVACIKEVTVLSVNKIIIKLFCFVSLFMVFFCSHVDQLTNGRCNELKGLECSGCSVVNVVTLYRLG